MKNWDQYCNTYKAVYRNGDTEQLHLFIAPRQPLLRAHVCATPALVQFPAFASWIAGLVESLPKHGHVEIEVRK